MRVPSVFVSLFVAVVIIVSGCAAPPVYYPPVPAERPEYYSAKDYFDGGVRNYRKGEYREALEDFDKAIQLKPDYVEAYYYVGLTNERIGRLNDAERAYIDSIRYDNRYLPSREALGLLLYNRNMFKDAEMQLGVAKSLGSTMPQVFYTLGQINMKENECRKGMAYFKEALRLDPLYPEARIALEDAEEHCQPKAAKPAKTVHPRQEKTFKGGGRAIDPENF
jgi:tetratricopeptide (TPR) repeat protein